MDDLVNKGSRIRLEGGKKGIGRLYNGDKYTMWEGSRNNCERILRIRIGEIITAH